MFDGVWKELMQRAQVVFDDIWVVRQAVELLVEACCIVLSEGHGPKPARTTSHLSEGTDEATGIACLGVTVL